MICVLVCLVLIGSTAIIFLGGVSRWDGWMASPTQWTWVWVDSGSWRWTGKPGVLQFMGSQRVGHDWVTELNWTELSLVFPNRPQSQNFHYGDILSKLVGKSLLTVWEPGPPQVFHYWCALRGAGLEHLRTKGEKHYEMWLLPGLCQIGRKQVFCKEAGLSLNLRASVKNARRLVVWWGWWWWWRWQSWWWCGRVKDF